MYYVKKTKDNIFVVGKGEGINWQPDSEHTTLAEASQEAAYMNGNPRPYKEESSGEISKPECDPNKPAFSNSSSVGDWEEGLTKREYFALHILSGLFADRELSGLDISTMAEHAVCQADALIKALNE